MIWRNSGVLYNSSSEKLPKYKLEKSSKPCVALPVANTSISSLSLILALVLKDAHWRACDFAPLLASPH